MPQKPPSDAQTTTENRYFREFLDDVCGPNEPMIKIYSVQANGKQTCIDCVFPDHSDYTKAGAPEFHFPSSVELLKRLRNDFGSGKYLLRTVHSNGRFGPSRVITIGGPPVKA
jgi:hypothetical protein